MASWLKLVGASDWPVEEHWVMQRSDLLTEVRFGERHPPTPIRRGDHLVYHAVVHGRVIAIVEVCSDEACFNADVEWERRWPWVVEIRVIMKVGRVSQGPLTRDLQLAHDLAHESFLPLTQDQYDRAVHELRAAGGR